MQKGKNQSASAGNGPAKPFRGAFVAIAAVALLAVGFLVARSWFGAAAGRAAVASASDVSIGGPFTLVNQDGSTVTDADLHGKWLLIYFGYTYCPDVCPTSLARNAQAIDLLGEQGEKVTPVMISVDPERDTPDVLKKYVAQFHPRLVGLTGTPQQVAAVARAYRVYYVKAPQTPDPKDYLVDHSSFTYLVDPDGRYVTVFAHNAKPEDIAAKIKPML